MQKTKTILLISFLLLFISIDVLNAFELTPGKGALEASRKILCSTIDDKPIVYWWYGRMYSRVQGESDKLLFRVEGMNIRACKSVKDSKRGNGFKMVSRELLFYQDPQTGEILAMATEPGFNNNQSSESPADFHRNRALTDQFEPGSTYKVVAATAAVATNTVSLYEILCSYFIPLKIKGFR